MVLAMCLVVEFLVLPQLAGARKALRLIGSVQPWWVATAVILEFAALAAYAELTRSLLPPAVRPGRWTVQRIDLSAFAVSHLVPGGSAAGAALSFPLLGDAGVPGPAAGFALATQGLGSAVVLNVLLWVALIVSIPEQGFDPLYASAAVLGAVLLAGCAALFMLLTRREAGSVRFVSAVARRVPFLDEAKVNRTVREIAARLRGLINDRSLVVRTVAWASANWLLDAASLWVFLLAFGFRAGPLGLLVAYGLANVLAAIPVTPGGLGIVEGVLVPTLVAFGAPHGNAILAVVGWRLVNFWLPIPIGAACYTSLRVGPQAAGKKRRVAVSSLVDEAEKQRRPVRQA